MDDVKIDFKQGLVPCIIQDSNTRVVLMLGFMNDEALNKTMKEGKVTFFSRSKNRLWICCKYSTTVWNLKNVSMTAILFKKCYPISELCNQTTLNSN